MKLTWAEVVEAVRQTRKGSDRYGDISRAVEAAAAPLIATELEAFAAELKAEERIIGSGGGTLGVESADIDRLLAERKGGR